MALLRARLSALVPRLLLGLGALFALMSAAHATCNLPVAARETPRLVPAGYVPAAETPGHVGLTFLGHASFLIESPQGVTIVTDYNGYIRPPFTPDIVTMNHAHSTHYTDTPDPGIKLVLRGWDPAGGVAQHDVTFGDVHIRSIPTNIRDYGTGGTRYAGNSIFVFDIEQLCIVHLSHLHHTLTAQHLADLGKVDVLLVPVDGTWTMSHEEMVEVVNEVKPTLVIPMHYFTRDVLDAFLDKLGPDWPVERSRVASIDLSRDTLPQKPQVLVLPGR
jgi:L-ascorbate metabolism protein UlaG (beta-lactamase superfamily)